MAPTLPDRAIGLGYQRAWCTARIRPSAPITAPAGSAADRARRQRPVLLTRPEIDLLRSSPTDRHVDRFDQRRDVLVDERLRPWPRSASVVLCSSTAARSSV